MPFASLNQIDEELNRLKQVDVQSKVEYNELASPTVYVQKKSKEIHICADFLAGLNNALKDYHYLLPSPKEFFAKLSGGIFFFQKSI